MVVLAINQMGVVVAVLNVLNFLEYVGENFLQIYFVVDVDQIK